MSQHAAARLVANEAVYRIGAPAAGASGFTLSVIAILTDRPVLLGIGGLGIAITLLSIWKRNSRHELPPIILAVTSSVFAGLAPFADGGLAISIIPILIILAFLGIFATSRQTAIRIAAWCTALSVWSFAWIYSGIGVTEIVVVIALLGGTAVSAYVVFIWANDARVKEEQSFWLLFEDSPIAIWEQDFTAAIEWLEELRQHGVTDLRSYLAERPDQTRHGAGLVGVRRRNTTAGRLIGADDPRRTGVEMVAGLGERELQPLVEMFTAVWEGRHRIGLDLTALRIAGRRVDGVLYWSVPVVDSKPDFSRVILTISDITPIREAEEKLQAAIASNELLASHEKAIATCSRALLLGRGAEGLHIALDTLRMSIGAETAYLIRNTEGAMQVEASSEPTDAGVEMAWDGWSTAARILSSGEVYQRDGNGAGSAVELAVPIFAGEEWMGAFLLVDSAEAGWSDAAVRLLRVAAPMFGTHWERERSRVRLEELVESKDQFIASVSHELRTPLSAVLGFSELLRAGNELMGPEDYAEMLELIVVQSQDMADMVEDLLVAARADIGTITVRPQDVYLRAQVEVALAGVDPSKVGSVELTGDHGKCWADPSRTRQIVRNLLSNAVRYGGDRIQVEVRTGSEETFLAVRDNGSGLSEAEAERIFEPYQRAHDRPTEPGSIGLGLTVSRQLARLMGGDVVYRADQPGTVFELRLPAEPGTGSTAEDTTPAPRAVPAATH